MPEWTNVVQSMIERFGKEPATVVVLLRFLGSLAEESLNTRLPRLVSRHYGEGTLLTLSQPEGTDVYGELVSGSAEAVINVLSMYIQAEGERFSGDLSANSLRPYYPNSVVDL